jgi:pimeloyl-ACP methyl ester carboxylesterase
MPVFLTNSKVRLALHELRAGSGRPLLLLHGLGERSPTHVPADVERWPGPIHALDFTGHGESTIPGGGGYTPEILMSDADGAVEHLGRATIAGRGLGAYVALLIAGGRPERVRGAILRDGPGLAGGGARGGSSHVDVVERDAKGPPDPFVFEELTRDVRPPDYASSFVRLATELSGLEYPITVCANARPDWLEAVVDEPGVLRSSFPAALASYARVE